MDTVTDTFNAEEIELLKRDLEGVTEQTRVIKLQYFSVLPPEYIKPLETHIFDPSPVIRTMHYPLTWVRFQLERGYRLAYIPVIDTLCIAVQR